MFTRSFGATDPSLLMLLAPSSSYDLSHASLERICKQLFQIQAFLGRKLFELRGARTPQKSALEHLQRLPRIELTEAFERRRQLGALLGIVLVRRRSTHRVKVHVELGRERRFPV